jgi:hypothetical protein
MRMNSDENPEGERFSSRRAAQATNLLFRGGIIVSPCRLLLHSDRIPRSLSDATAQSKTMQIPSPTTMVPFLTTILVSAAVQAIGAPFSDTRVTAPSTSPRLDLAVLQAPIGHRQPTLDDLPEWLREIERPGIEAKSTQDRRPHPRSQKTGLQCDEATG